jgi:hypothetical protein
LAPPDQGAGSGGPPETKSLAVGRPLGSIQQDAVAIAAPFLPATTVAEVKGKSCTENGGGKLKDREKGFFVVFDGHGGLRVAEACRERMHMVLAEDVDRLWAGDYKDDQRRAVEGGHGSLLRACGRRGRRHRRV